MRVEFDLLHEAAQRELNYEEYTRLFIYLSNTPVQHLKDSISPGDLVRIISYIDLEENENGVGLVKLLFRLFPRDFVSESSELIIDILSGNHEIVTVFLNEMHSFLVSQDSDQDEIYFTNEVIKKCIELIYNQAIDVSEASKKLLNKFVSQSKEYLLIVLDTIYSYEFPRNVKNDLNFIEMIVQLSAQSYDVRENQIFSQTFFDVVKDNLREDDELCAVNIIEILKCMTEVHIKWALQSHSNIFDTIYDNFLNTNNHILSIEISLSLFCKCINTDPNYMLNKYNNLIYILENNIYSSTDPTLTVYYIESLASCCTLNQCKIIMDNLYGDVVLSVLDKMVNMLINPTTENKYRILNALSHLIGIIDIEQTNISRITRKWFHRISNQMDLCHFLITTITTPFEDARVACFQFLSSLSTQQWGIEWIFECKHESVSLVKDILLKRKDEYKLCIDMKWDLLRSLRNHTILKIQEIQGDGSRQLEEYCNSDVLAALKLYIEQGKYYGINPDEADHGTEMQVETANT